MKPRHRTAKTGLKLTDQLMAETEAMATYALASGLKMPASLVETVRGRTGAGEPSGRRLGGKSRRPCVPDPPGDHQAPGVRSRPADDHRRPAGIGCASSTA